MQKTKKPSTAKPRAKTGWYSVYQTGTRRGFVITIIIMIIIMIIIIIIINNDNNNDNNINNNNKNNNNNNNNNSSEKQVGIAYLTGPRKGFAIPRTSQSGPCRLCAWSGSHTLAVNSSSTAMVTLVNLCSLLECRVIESLGSLGSLGSLRLFGSLKS